MATAKKEQLRIGKRVLELSNLDKVMFPAVPLTKAEVIDYYIRVSDFILPHLKNRPLTLKRYPEGVEGPHFYEKEAPGYRPDWMTTFAVPRKRAKGADTTIDYVLINDLPSLVWTVNLANLEMHTLLSRVPRVDLPSSLVFDLDPGEPAGLLECAELGLKLRALFEELGLVAFAKVSGAKGMQLYVPLNGRATFTQTAAFAEHVARTLAEAYPNDVTASMLKSDRAGKVFIDWSQNAEHKSTVCVYSLRAKQQTPLISLPFEWDEIDEAVETGDAESLYLQPDAALARLKKRGDLFANVLTLKQSLPKVASVAAPLAASEPALREYGAKRNFTKTSEPPPKRGTRQKTGERLFVIQKHQASHLHFDLRLEMGGTLKSWAVPKGLSTVPAEQRLAMHVEDHPVEYATFEGTIPPGNYGAGTVMVWDTGTYEVAGDNPMQAFHQGKLELEFSGKKLKGKWKLFRTDEKKWLVVKVGAGQRALSSKQVNTSAVTGRTLEHIAADADAQWESNRRSSQKANPAQMPAPDAAPTVRTQGEDAVTARALRTLRAAIKKLPAAAPHYIEPMKAKAVTKLPAEGDWSYELKFDGYRAVAVVQKKAAEVFSRNGKDLGRKFATLTDNFTVLPCDSAVIDGELVAVDAQGKPSFQILQNALTKGSATQLTYFAFDLLNLDGHSLMGLPLTKRREHLASLISGSSIRLSETLDASPDQIVDAIRRLGLEGVVAKQRSSKYEPGKRSGAWVKFKTNKGQEFVVGGYTPGNPFDSLLVGYYKGKNLNYAGKIKAGFTRHTRDLLWERLQKMRTPKCPFANLPESKSGRWGEGLTKEDMAKCVWLKPAVVVQIDFQEWTANDHLRHPAYVGLREDKKPLEVIRET